jgi:hypothetical protein
MAIIVPSLLLIFGGAFVALFFLCDCHHHCRQKSVECVKLVRLIRRSSGCFVLALTGSCGPAASSTLRRSSRHVPCCRKPARC